MSAVRGVLQFLRLVTHLWMRTAGSRSGVSGACDDTGRVRVDDQGMLTVPADHEPVEGGLDRGGLGVECRLAGAQGLAPPGYDLPGPVVC